MRWTKKTPWHVTQFFPTYNMVNIPRTPITTLSKAREIGLRVGLRYVYEGNTPGELGENTYCHKCKKIIIQRFGYIIQGNKINNSGCTFCGEKIDGVFQD